MTSSMILNAVFPWIYPLPLSHGIDGYYHGVFFYFCVFWGGFFGIKISSPGLTISLWYPLHQVDNSTFFALVWFYLKIALSWWVLSNFQLLPVFFLIPSLFPALLTFIWFKATTFITKVPFSRHFSVAEPKPPHLPLISSTPNPPRICISPPYHPFYIHNVW